MKDASCSRAWARGLALALLAGLIPAAWLEAPLLRDPWTVHDDARQVVYQARLAARSSLLAADPNARHASLYLPAALAFGYRALDRWIDPLTLTKVLPLVLSTLLAGLIYAAVARRHGAAAGVAAAALVSLHSWSRWPPQWGAGDAGEWLAPLVASFLCAMELEAPWAAAAVLIVAAHVYPPAFMLIGGAAGLLVVHSFITGVPRISRASLILTAGAMAGAALLVARTVGYDEGDFGRLFTLAEAHSMVEFSPRGRSPLFFDDTWRSFSNDRSGLALDAPTLALLALAAVSALAAGRARRGPGRAGTALTVTGLSLWLAARYLVFLYQPVRFVVVTLPIVAAWVAGASLERALARLTARVGRPAGLAGWALVSVSVMAFAAPRLYASHVTASPPALYQAIRKLPGDARIAGPPMMLDFVPPFGERRIVVGDEMMPPMFVRRYEVVHRLMTEMLTAYLSADPREVDAFCARHQVTHWIVDLDDFRDGATWSYFPPFDAIVTRARERGAPYALADAARDRNLPLFGHYALIECPLRATPDQPPS